MNFFLFASRSSLKENKKLIIEIFPIILNKEKTKRRLLNVFLRYGDSIAAPFHDYLSIMIFFFKIIFSSRSPSIKYAMYAIKYEYYE